MKKISIALFSFVSLFAFAESKEITIKGQAALELFDRIERTGVEREVWTDDQGVDHLSLSVRKMVCDTNYHTEPNPTLCTILPGFMKKPIVSEGDKARNIIKAMNPVEEAGNAQDIYFADCAMGKCSHETGYVSCFFAKNDTANATCYVESGFNF